MVRHTNLKMTFLKNENFVLRSLETGSTALPHRATWGSTRLSQEVEGARQSTGKAFIVVSL